MWVCLNDAFLSIVHKDCGRDELLVRARRLRDLRAVFPTAKIKTGGATTDYRYRAVVKRGDVEDAMVGELRRITYGNFKDSVKDDKLHDAYLRVWTTMWSLQPGRQRETAAVNDKPQRYAVVGMKHRKAEAFVEALPPDAPLMLVREADNKFDRNAVQVWAKDGDGWRHVGYVPKTQNQVLAQFIDAMGQPWRHVVAAGGSGMGLDEQHSDPLRQAVDGRLHKGSNTYPLVEVA